LKRLRIIILISWFWSLNLGAAGGTWSMQNYPFDEPLDSLFYSSGKASDHKGFNQAILRCAAIMKILGGTGYLEGEGLLQQVSSYYDVMYTTAVTNDLRLTGEGVTAEQPRDETMNRLREHGETYWPIWQQTEQLYIDVYSGWISTAGFGADIIDKNPSHPWSADQRSCLKWAKYLYDVSPKS